MQTNRTVEWCKLSLKISGYLVSFSSYPPFCTIGWWRLFVCETPRKYTRFTIYPGGNRLKEDFFSWNAILNIVSIYETIFIPFFSSGERFPLTVTFQRSDTPIFPHTILVVCIQNDVTTSLLKLVDKIKTKCNIKEI